MNLPIGRHGSDTAQGDPLDGKGVASAEERSYVLRRPYIIEHDHQRQLRHRGKRFDRRPAQLFIRDFSHDQQLFSEAKVT